MNSVPRAAAAALTSGLLAATCLAVGPRTASADPGDPYGYSWCPGQALPVPGIRWDESVCHVYYDAPTDQANVLMVDLQGNPTRSWLRADSPPELRDPPPPAAPPPGAPFCSPRGALFIVGPICDEIGVDSPHGSVRR